MNIEKVNDELNIFLFLISKILRENKGYES